MTETDLSDWLPIADTAAILRCSKRTVERRFRDWHIEQRFRPQAGSPAVAVYNPDDVRRRALESHPAPAPFVLPAVPTSHDQSGNGNGPRRSIARVSTGPDDDPIRQLFAAALRAVLSPPSPPVSERIGGERLYLTLPEAAAWTGLTEAYLRRKCRDGSLPAIKDVAWKIKRTDLETL